MKKPPPVVVVIGGLDPSGGAGLVADIQTLSALGCHAAPVITAVTIQDTVGVKKYETVDADLIQEQLKVILEDYSPTIIKTGMLATNDIVCSIINVLKEYPKYELIIDPVLASNMNNSLSEHSLLSALKEKLLPLASLVTPNIPEAEQLFNINFSDNKLNGLNTGVDCLVTGTHADSKEVINRYYKNGSEIKQWSWPRLAYEYHGSGCTLASAVAAELAKGETMQNAISQAQTFVYSSLKQGFKPGKGQHIPNRVRR